MRLGFQRTTVFVRRALKGSVLGNNFSNKSTPFPVRASGTTSGQQPSSPGNAGDMSKFTVEVCKESEIGEGNAGIRQVKLGEFPVLVGRADNRLFAVGGRCPHFGLPLAGGKLSDHSHCLRCPFHGACFNVFTGDIEDAPGQDCLPTFSVSVRQSDKMVVVEGAPPPDGGFVVKRPAATFQQEFASESYVIVGGGPGAVAAADTLRQEGYRGRLTVLSAESVAPYDRVKLSKFMAAEPALLRPLEHYKQHGIELKLDSRVLSVNLGERTVQVQTNGGKQVVPYTKLLVCSGSAARRLPGALPKHGIHYLREIQEAKQIHTDGQGADAVMIGSSFIGLEVAAYLVANGAKSVTVLARDQVPFQALFGDDIGSAVRKLFESKGVKYIVDELDTFTEDAQGRLTGLKLKSGTTLPAQLCVVGIGSTPCTDFLPAKLLAGERAGGALVVGADLKSPIDANVYGAGDCLGYGHWQTAQNQGRMAARSMLGKPVTPQNATFFWTFMFGTVVRYTALAAGGDGRPTTPWKRAVPAEKVDETKFMNYLVDDKDQVVAGVSFGVGPHPAALANELAKGKPLPLKSLKL